MADDPLLQPDRRKPGSYGRRYIDRKWPRHLRDFWLLVITAIVLFAVAKNGDTSTQASRTAAQAERIARETTQLAHANRQLVLQVQAQRYQAALDACRETNHRHAQTIQQIHRQIKTLEHRKPARKAVLDAQERSTSLIIQALTPFRKNCRRFASRITHNHSQ